MTWVAKYKWGIVLGVLIILFYFLMRLPNLTLQPIFADEAIYIRWAQIMKSEPTLRFVSLQDGKTPLFMWLMTPLFKVFPDPLYAGRFLSILSGFATMIGVFALSLKVFNIRVALLSALIYSVVPYMVFFDRMALVDSMLASFTIWSIYLAVWLTKSPRLDLAMILGYFLGGGLLIKTPGMMNLLALPVTIIAVNFKNYTKYSLSKLFLFWGVAILIALTMYNLLRLGPDFVQLSARNGDYVFSLDELKGRPLDPFIPHFHDLVDWFPKLLTIPVLIFIFIGIGASLKHKNKLSWIIWLWPLVPLLLQMAFLKTFTARYILFSIPPLLIMAGFGVNWFLARVKVNSIKLMLLLSLVVAVSPLYYSYLIVHDVENAKLPVNERRGYFEGWTAGYGFKEIAKYLVEKQQEKEIVVGTEGAFGTLPEGLQIYLDKSGIPIIKGGATVSADLRNTAKLKPTYFVGNKSISLRAGVSNSKIIMAFPKLTPLQTRFSQDEVVLYQIFPENEK